MNTPKRIFKASAVLCLLMLIHPAASHANRILLKNARIFSMSEKGTLEKGMILINGGKIERVGVDLEYPEETRVYDLAGRTVIPGMICASSSLYLHPEDSIHAGEESADADILEGLHFFDLHVQDALSEGITAYHLSSVAYHFVGGLGAVVKPGLQGTGSVEILKRRADLNLRIERMQENRTSNLMRLIQYHRIRDLFIQAREYREARREYESRLKEYLETPEAAGGEPRPQAPKRDEPMDILVSALEGEIPVRIEARRPDAILNALKLREEFSLDLILEKCEDWPLVLPQIEKAAVPVLSNPLLNPRKVMIPGGPKGYAAVLLGVQDNPVLYSGSSGFTETVEENGGPKAEWRKLADHGIPFVLIPPDAYPLSTSSMRFQASLLRREGFTTEEALGTITSTAARVLGVDDRIGSLEEGKDADLVVLNGDPLNSLSKIEMVFLNGKPVRENTK